MNEEEHLAAVCELPRDNAPRLRYADWLEAHDIGDGNRLERAEFIRTQINLDKMTGNDRERPLLVARTEELLKAHREQWERPMRDLGAEKVTFRRGFPARLTLSTYDFVNRGEQLFLRAPIDEAIIKIWHDDDMQKLAISPNLLRLRSLNLMANTLGSKHAHVLATSPYLCNLEGLDLQFNGIGPEGAQALAESPHLSQLVYLNLAHNRIESAGAQALAESKHLGKLAEINLFDNAIDVEGARILTLSPSLTSLSTIDFRGNNFDEHVSGEIGRLLHGRATAREVRNGAVL